MERSVTNVFCGVDLGGTTINMGMVTPDGAIVAEQHFPSHVERGVDFVVHQIASVLNQSCGVRDEDIQVEGVGIGVAGLVDSQNGILKEATNLPGWNNVPLVDKLHEILNLPVIMENDANVAALGEFSFGAGHGYPNMIMVTLGTGVGAGLILDGLIYRGAYGAAGEFGHITIKLDGDECGCGRRGCVEAYVGTKGLRRDAVKMLKEHPESTLNQYDPDLLTPKDIFTEAQNNDPVARDVFRHAGNYLGIGLGNVVNLLNIQRVVLGGGVALAGELLIGSAQEALSRAALNNSKEPVRIVKAQLGEHAGIIGAASLAMSSF